MTTESSPGSGSKGRALLTGATGYIGSRLAPQLLEAGWSLTVLSRHPEAVRERAWAQGSEDGDASDSDPRIRIVQGDAESADDLQKAFDGVDVAYYLLHSMDGQGDFRERDRELARGFASAAAAAGVRRIVYLSGLHPAGVELSDHLASRVEVGEIFLDSPVPTAVLQAAVIIGAGSASFEMLRHLTHRLPAMVAPKWLNNRIQPIAIADVLAMLVAAADLPSQVSRTIDIGGPDVLTYRQLIQRFAAAEGLRPRVMVAVPVLTPWLASHWIGLVTPVPTGLAKPLVGSLVHEVVCRDDDARRLLGLPAPRTLNQAVADTLAGPVRGSQNLPEPGEADPAWLTTADPAWAG